ISDMIRNSASQSSSSNRLKISRSVSMRGVLLPNFIIQLLFEFYNGDAGLPFAVFAGTKLCHIFVLAQVLAYPLPQLARPHTVDDFDLFQTGKDGAVKKSIRLLDRFGNSHPQQIDFRLD